MSKDKLVNILDEKKHARRNKIKGVIHTPSKELICKSKIIKKTIELLYTPSKNSLLSKK